MHVPLVMAGPGIPQGRSDALVYLLDLFPTLCDFAGAAVPAKVEGRSLKPIVEGRQDKVRDVLFTAYQNCQRAIRDGRWKLIRYPLVDKTQLFDLQSDPRELHNLADQPEPAAKIAELTALLEREQQRYGDPAPLKVADPKPAEWTPPQSAEVKKPKAKRKQGL
jgi:arylsulfatase A-like enzyme